MFGQVCFDLFDTKKQEFLSGDDLGDIMRAMGFRHLPFLTFNNILKNGNVKNKRNF